MAVSISGPAVGWIFCLMVLTDMKDYGLWQLPIAFALSH